MDSQFFDPSPFVSFPNTILLWELMVSPTLDIFQRSTRIDPLL